MASRSLNKVQLIGNLTRDPELRYTPNGTAVCTLGLATNRTWVTESGEKKEDVEYHRLVAWSKLAELCSQLLVKGRKVYVEGRLKTRQWTGQDGSARSTTEIVINDMLILDSRKGNGEDITDEVPPPEDEQAYVEAVEAKLAKPQAAQASKAPTSDETKAKPSAQEQTPGEVEEKDEHVNPDDIPF